MAFRKPSRSLFLSIVLAIDFAMFAYAVFAGSAWPAGSVVVGFSLMVCLLDAASWRLMRWGLLARGALAAITVVGALINLPRSLNPGAFDVIVVGPGASLTLAVMSAFIIVPCLNAYERLSPKHL